MTTRLGTPDNSYEFTRDWPACQKCGNDCVPDVRWDRHYSRLLLICGQCSAVSYMEPKVIEF